MRRFDTELNALQDLRTQAERDAATRLLLRINDPTARADLMDLLCLRRRARRKEASDAQTDLDRRILVGARLPRYLADVYRDQARARRRSMYAWCCEAYREKFVRERGVEPYEMVRLHHGADPKKRSGSESDGDDGRSRR